MSITEPTDIWKLLRLPQVYNKMYNQSQFLITKGVQDYDSNTTEEELAAVGQEKYLPIIKIEFILEDAIYELIWDDYESEEQRNEAFDEFDEDVVESVLLTHLSANN